MTTRAIGWTFVAVQAVLFATVVLLPGADHWPTPEWLRLTAMALIVAGIALIAVAALRLGPALTATPVPTAQGELSTTGLYRVVRHPIYTGVIAALIGAAVRSGNIATAATVAVGIGFFHAKARWEEGRLRDRYPGYAAYAEHTPRFMPRPWPFRPSSPAVNNTARQIGSVPPSCETRTMLAPGHEAPAFTLPDQNEEPFTLADLRGRWVLLWWYPKAATPG